MSPVSDFDKLTSNLWPTGQSSSSYYRPNAFGDPMQPRIEDSQLCAAAASAEDDEDRDGIISDGSSEQSISSKIHTNKNFRKSLDRVDSLSCYQQIYDLSSLLQSHESIEPGVATEFQAIVQTLIQDIEKQTDEISRLAHTIKLEKENANSKLVQYEEDSEREFAKREDFIRKEERARYEKILNDLETKYQRVMQTNEHISAEIRRANWIEKRNGSSSGSKSVSSTEEECREGVFSTTMLKGLEKELELLKNTLFDNLDEIRSTKEIINHSIREQNELLRDQLSHLTRSNSKLMDENDMLKSQVLMCAGGPGSANSRYSMVSSTSAPLDLHSRSRNHPSALKRSYTETARCCTLRNEDFIEGTGTPLSPPPSPTEHEEMSISTSTATDFTPPGVVKLCNYKIIFLGDSSVGKTSLIRGICGNEFVPFSKATLGVDFFSKQVECNDQVVNVHLWDTAGQERFRCLCRSYYRRADAVVLVYDISNERSFQSMSGWLSELQVTATSNLPSLLLVANKLDLRSDSEAELVSRTAGAEMAESIGADFIEVSARTGLNVADIMTELISKMHQTTTERRTNPSNLQIATKQPKPQARKKCC